MTRRHGTMGRNIRIPEDLWQAFKQLAKERGTSASAEIVWFVRLYVRGAEDTKIDADTSPEPFTPSAD